MHFQLTKTGPDPNFLTVQNSIDKLNVERKKRGDYNDRLDAKLLPIFIRFCKNIENRTVICLMHDNFVSNARQN